VVQIRGVKVQVYRIQDPIHGDDTKKFDAAVLAAPVITRERLLEADCIIIGAPGRQGGFAGEVRLFLDSLAAFQRPAVQGNTSQLMVRTFLSRTQLHANAA
jgi:NAD(P)H dehydrogenase (quinone)